jgi:diaminohydroxyphosphoribosylaminopyrimidine deaminase / 5-amino-6-(5-phosphoribosylamino)uracil reductase
MVNDAEVLHMNRALALAERGRGRTSPNPMVGAVVVDRQGVVVGRGWHELAGGPHAEVGALAEAGERSRGATLYVTLEPCTHVGRTGPCAPRVVEAGIERAVIAVEDPNPIVAGRGIALLRRNGIDVRVGVLADRARRLNAAFFTRMRRARPFVTLKSALTLDGCVARAPGVRTALTGQGANRAIHRERAEVDAIGVGSGTVLVDDPLLTPRGAFRRRPLVRVIFDRRLRTPPGARVLSTAAAGPVIIVTTASAIRQTASGAAALTAAGARLEAIEDGADERFLPAALGRLTGLGVTSLVIEGGPTLHEAFWRAKLVDRVQFFLTPHIAGPDGLPGAPFPVGTVAALVDASARPIGEDILIEGYVHGLD